MFEVDKDEEEVRKRVANNVWTKFFVALRVCYVDVLGLSLRFLLGIRR